MLYYKLETAVRKCSGFFYLFGRISVFNPNL